VLRSVPTPGDDAEESTEPDGDVAAEAVPPSVDVRPLTPRELRALWSHVRGIDNFWATLDEIEPGAIRRLAELTDEHQWHVVFMTRRPRTRGESVQRQSQRWLQDQGFPLPSVCVVPHSRGALAGVLELDAVIDDRPETCLDVVADSKATSILVWRGDTAGVPAGAADLGVNVVPSFAAALDRLEALSAASMRRPGLLERLTSAWRPR
jgi:hypothetical protein